MYAPEKIDYAINRYTNNLLGARPAVQRGLKVLAHLRRPITDDTAREVLFGKTQYEKR